MVLELQKSPSRNRLYCTRHLKMSSLINTMSSLHDVYASLGDEQRQQASYMLQFVWCDLTSSFDIIGPYYSSSEPLKSKFILACVYEVMKIFQILWVSNIGVGV